MKTEFKSASLKYLCDKTVPSSGQLGDILYLVSLVSTILFPIVCIAAVVTPNVSTLAVLLVFTLLLVRRLYWRPLSRANAGHLTGARTVRCGRDFASAILLRQ